MHMTASPHRLASLFLTAAIVFSGALCMPASAKDTLILGVGMFQPDREKNDATYRPLARYLTESLGQPVELRTVDSWEGLAKSLATSETDLALMGPWGYVLANHVSQAQVVSTIEYQGKPQYHAIIITHPASGIDTVEDLLGKKGQDMTFAFGDMGSTSGYLIPSFFFLQNNINPQKHFKRVLHTKHQAIEMQVTSGRLDAGADYDRNRTAMIEQGLIAAQQSRVIWRSEPLPNDAFAVRAGLYEDEAFVERLRAALGAIGARLNAQPSLLPTHYTGFVDTDNDFYKPIRDAGLATGKLAPR